VVPFGSGSLAVYANAGPHEKRAEPRYCVAVSPVNSEVEKSSKLVDHPEQVYRPDLFLLRPDVVHLNHGSYGAVPLPVLAAQSEVSEAIERSPEQFYRADLAPAMDAVRAQVAAFLHTDPGGLALVQNATEAVQVVLEAVGFAPGNEILFTDHTYWWVQTAIARACERYGAVARRVPLPITEDRAEFEADLIAAIQAGITPRTALVVLDQITSASALRLPVEALIASLPEHVPVLVDAAHAPGLIEEPVPGGAAFWLGNLHKWAFSARTAAALVVAPHWRERVRPLVASAGAADGFPRSFSYLGTQDPSAYLALPAALTFPERDLSVSFQRLRERNTAVLNAGLAYLADRLDVAPAKPNGLPLNVIDLGHEANDGSAAALTGQLRDEGVEVAITAVNGRLHARVSVQAYVAPADFERLGDALAKHV